MPRIFVSDARRLDRSVLTTTFEKLLTIVNCPDSCPSSNVKHPMDLKIRIDGASQKFTAVSQGVHVML